MSEARWEASEEGGEVAVEHVCPVRLVSNGLLTCEVEDIVEGAGVTVVVGGKETIQCSSRGAHPCQHLVYLEECPVSCLPDVLVWLEGFSSDQCRVRGTTIPTVILSCQRLG